MAGGVVADIERRAEEVALGREEVRRSDHAHSFVRPRGQRAPDRHRRLSPRSRGGSRSSASTPPSAMSHPPRKQSRGVRGSPLHRSRYRVGTPRRPSASDGDRRRRERVGTRIRRTLRSRVARRSRSISSAMNRGSHGLPVHDLERPRSHVKSDVGPTDLLPSLHEAHQADVSEWTADVGEHLDHGHGDIQPECSIVRAGEEVPMSVSVAGGCQALG